MPSLQYLVCSQLLSLFHSPSQSPPPFSFSSFPPPASGRPASRAEKRREEEREDLHLGSNRPEALVVRAK
uniref:Uncharacterized protein n=1 Tax=Oryza punctata TaxID=4537 RepID=A0A0E0MEH5_ORYPU